MAAICLLLAACSGGERRIDQGDAENVLHFGNGTEPQAIDPHITTGIPEYHIQEAVFEGLVSKDRAVLQLRRRCAPAFQVMTPAEAVHWLDAAPGSIGLSRRRRSSCARGSTRSRTGRSKRSRAG